MKELENEVVYVCSPLSAPTQEGIRANMLQARVYMEKVKAYLHCRAVAPHAYLPELLDDQIPQERQIGFEFGLKILMRSKALVICGDRISNGMQTEIDLAFGMGIPVFILDEHGRKACMARIDSLGGMVREEYFFKKHL